MLVFRLIRCPIETIRGFTLSFVLTIALIVSPLSSINEYSPRCFLVYRHPHRAVFFAHPNDGMSVRRPMWHAIPNLPSPFIHHTRLFPAEPILEPIELAQLRSTVQPRHPHKTRQLLVAFWPDREFIESPVAERDA